MASKSQRGGDHVVHPTEDAQQVRLHGQRVVQLAGPDLVHPQSPDGQVGVLQHLVLTVGDVLGQPVGPAAVAAVGVGVFQALGGGVADRDVSGETSSQIHSYAFPCRRFVQLLLARMHEHGTRSEVPHQSTPRPLLALRGSCRGSGVGVSAAEWPCGASVDPLARPGHDGRHRPLGLHAEPRRNTAESLADPGDQVVHCPVHVIGDRHPGSRRG